MELRLYFQMLKRGWWVILLTALVAFVATLGASYVVTPRYKATARFIINPTNIVANNPDLGLWGFDILGNQTITTTYMEVMKSDRIYQNALASLELVPDEVKAYDYAVEVLPNSSVMELSVSGPSAQLTADIANAIGEQTTIFTAQLNEYYIIDVLDEAFPPVIPESPQPLRDSILAFSVGLILGGVLAIVRDQILTSLDTYRLRFQVDRFTGVYNRRHITHLLENELAQNPEEVLSIGIIEIGGLEELEGALPESGFQNVLRQVTVTLKNELRGHDTIGRWNDNSFLVVLPKTSGSAANRIFERIYHSLSVPVELERLNLSIDLEPLLGGAEYSSNITSDELIEKADEALDKARKNKANPIYIWEIKNPFWGGEDLSK